MLGRDIFSRSQPLQLFFIESLTYFFSLSSKACKAAVKCRIYLKCCEKIRVTGKNENNGGESRK